MGGSGGATGGSFPRKPTSAEVSRLVREAQEQAARDKRDAEANHELLDLLAAYNDRDTDAVRERIASVERALGSDIDVDAILFGGSVAKHTYVDGLSDIDALVVLDEPDALEAPADLKAAFVRLLEKKLPMGDVMSIQEGDLAVTVTYRDGTELQLLPAKRAGERLEISDSSGQQWSHIDPAAFRQALSEVNQFQSGAVVPTVKLAKAVISNLPVSRQLTGYHIEALAVDVFRAYDGRKTPVSMLRHFFRTSADRVRRPIPDVTGQSMTVDAYLGPSGSTERKLVADALATVSRSLQSAASPDRWRALVAGDE